MKSLLNGIGKGGLEAVSKNCMTWNGWSGFYRTSGFKPAGSVTHHWLLEKGWFTKGSFGWRLSNQMPNLVNMNDGMVIRGTNYNAFEIHNMFHGKFPDVKLRLYEHIYYRAIYTPNWFKVGTLNGIGHIKNLRRDF